MTTRLTLIEGLQGTGIDVSQPSPLVYVGLIAGLMLALLVFVIWWKGRRLPGEFVFRASRLSRGNHLFPAQVVLTTDSLTLYRPRWIGRLEESIHMAHIASVKIDTHLAFADIYIETSGGQDPVICHGHTKGDAVRMKALIERSQSQYYGKKA